ncbi:MAG: ATP-binding protein [Salinivirgaceae bacterium]|nr:ATP-binding protein [Salinivirgaceae bacterium]
MNNQIVETATAGLSQARKEQIVELLDNFVDHKGSANKAAKTLTTVSGGTISNMKSGKWTSIADGLWLAMEREIKQQFAVQNSTENLKQWNIVETRDYVAMQQFMSDAQTDALVLAITGEAGSGKSIAIKDYASKNHEVYALSCSSYWRPRLFLSNLLRAMGRDSGGYSVGEMMDEIVYHIKRDTAPLIILDEADKLPDEVLYFFISMYNEVEEHCGIVLCATDNLEKRIKRGLRLNKKGYKEIYSRIGRRFIKLAGGTDHDIAQVCMANGITEPKHINSVVDDSDGDFRRVKRKVYGLKKGKR